MGHLPGQTGVHFFHPTPELAQTHDCIRGVSLMRNCGQHNALLCGIRAAGNQLIITIDDDLQNPPEEILGMCGTAL